MSGSQLLRLRVNERLEAAVEEIFGLVEKTITEYEEEAVRSKREIGHLKQQLEQLVVLKSEVILNRADTQPLSEERPPSLQQYEINAKEIPVLEEAKIQEHPRVKEERRLRPDMEVVTWNKAEVKREIDRLKQHIELPAVLKAEVTSFRADMQEIRPSQQPDCVVAEEEVKTHEAKQIREEQEEMSISPDVEADAFNVDEVRAPDSEPDEYCEPLSSSEAETVNEERTEMHRSSSPLLSRSAELEQPPRGDKSCRFCGEHFSKDSFLVRHVATSHKGHKAFRCLDCNKEFDRRAWMITHTRVHTGEKPFRCDFCDRTFTHNASRLYHMKQHTGEKLSANQKEALTCFVCNKEFKHKRYLVMHARIHAGEKPFSCDFCGKTFIWKRNLPVHMKRHTCVHNGGKNLRFGVSLTEDSLENRRVLFTCGSTMERNRFPVRNVARGLAAEVTGPDTLHAAQGHTTQPPCNT